MKQSTLASVLATVALPLAAHAQSSSCGPAPSGSIRPSVASGYSLQVVATGLSKPRGIALDSAGHLLVVQQGIGSISAHVFNESSGCLTLVDTRNVTGSNMALNHGIQVSEDGRTLYASSTSDVYSWDYNAEDMTVSNQQTLVSNMSGTDHTTRTLLLSRKAPGMLVVARGSLQNLDPTAETLSTGISQVRAFNLNNLESSPYSYDTDGVRLGWGLRNEVGVGEHPNSGGIWGVENSADQITRMGVDVHENNPAEELNFLGYLNGTEYAQQGSNFGYPWCFTAWDVSGLPNNGNLTTGKQFAIDQTTDLNNMNKTDAYCAQQVAPRLAFQAHMAPLDIKFNNSGTEAWITFHGSWDRDVPVGYKLSVVEFTSGGEPTEPSTSTSAARDVISNQDITKCPNNCFRPVGLVVDSQGRIFMSSDASGEIYLVSRVPGSSGTSSASPSPSGQPSSTGTRTGTASTSGASASTTANAAPAYNKPSQLGFGAAFTMLLSVVMSLF